MAKAAPSLCSALVKFSKFLSAYERSEGRAWTVPTSLLTNMPRSAESGCRRTTGRRSHRRTGEQAAARRDFRLSSQGGKRDGRKRDRYSNDSSIKISCARGRNSPLRVMKVLPKMGERHAKGREAAVGARERSREDGAAAGRGRKHAGETERERVGKKRGTRRAVRERRGTASTSTPK